MDSLLGMLILVLPGIIGYYASKQIGPSDLRAKSDYEKTAIGLILNLPGLLICWAGYSIMKKESATFSQFQTSIMKLGHFLLYVLVTLVSSIIIVIIWDMWFRKKSSDLINVFRKRQQRPRTSFVSPWEEFYGYEGSGFLRIYPMGERDKFVLGEMNSGYIPGEVEKGILLSTTNELHPWDYWFPKSERTYVDVVTKMVYEYFPTSAWKEAKRRAETETQSSQSFLGGGGGGGGGVL